MRRLAHSMILAAAALGPAFALDAAPPRLTPELAASIALDRSPRLRAARARPGRGALGAGRRAAREPAPDRVRS